MNTLANTYRSAFGGLPRSVWVLSLILLVNRSGTMVIPFTALYLTSQRGYTAQDAGLLLSVYGMGSIIGSLLGGWLATTLGSIRTQIASLACAAPLFLTIPLAPGRIGLACNLLLLSIVADALRPASATSTASLCPPDLHKKAFALTRLAVNLGMTLGPAIGGFLCLISFRFLFVIDACTSLAAAGLTLAFFGWHSATPDRVSPHPAAPAAPAPWRDTTFILFGMLLIVVAVVFFQLMATYPLYLRQQVGLIESEIGLLFAINPIVIVLFEMVLVHHLQSANDLRVVGWGAACICLGFGLTVWAGNLWLCVASMLIWTVGEMLAMPLSLAFANSRSSAGNRGLYLGLYTSCYAIASVLAPAIGTWLYQQDPNRPWQVCLGLTLPILLAFYGLSYRDERARRASSAGE